MLTLEKLKEMGISTEKGLARCMNKEAFYFKMIIMGLSNEYFDALETALNENRLDDAFEMAHGLKGVIGNLELDPIYTPLAEMTEMLRAKKPADYITMYVPIKEMRDQLLLMNEQD
mgnify:CR=1 FL=1